MESTSTAAWSSPYELQRTMNWPAEEAPAPADDAQDVWAPAIRHPALQYSSTVDIFGSSCSRLQPYVVPASTSIISSCSVAPQLLVDYYNYFNYHASAAQNHAPTTTHEVEEDLSPFEQQIESYMIRPEKLFQERRKEFENAYSAEFLKRKMHRYPRSIRALDDGRLYTFPRVVSIGPYHHYGGDHLKEAEEVKHTAACHCIMKSGRSVQEMYGAVISAANDGDARGLYHTDVMMAAGLGGDDCFLPMMFFDACFLVMYIIKRSGIEEVDPTLYDFFESNDDDIAHDIMLLENQVPLQVVDAVMRMCAANPMNTMEKFIARCKDGCLQDRVVVGFPPLDWDQDYYNKAPHLLGLLRFYVVGKRKCRSKVSESDKKRMESIRISASAVEFAEMGIFLTAKETTELPDVGLARKWIIFKELSMAPLSLNDASASWLVNMAALELCATPDFFDDNAELEDSAVCSYLLLLCMLMHREEDVHELRTKGVLQGGAGLTNKKTLDFFTSLQRVRKGPCYGTVMVEIQNYRMKRWGWWLWLYKFGYQNGKIIAGIVSVVSAAGGIIGTLWKLKGAH